MSGARRGQVTRFTCVRLATSNDWMTFAELARFEPRHRVCQLDHLGR